MHHQAPAQAVMQQCGLHLRSQGRTEPWLQKGCRGILTPVFAALLTELVTPGPSWPTHSTREFAALHQHASYMATLCR